MESKIDFAVVFTNFIRSVALPEEASIHSAEMRAIKVALEEKTKDE